MSEDEREIDISFLGHDPFERLKTLMQRLRDPQEGCPWDRQQSFATIAPYTIEEAYEVSEAITQNNMSNLKEELGDLLFQIIFYAQIADEKGKFDLQDICDGLTRKMVTRHPHIFGKAKKRNAEEQNLAWEDIKASERAQKAKAQHGDMALDQGTSLPTSVLDDVALALPALMRAEKLQKRAARVGFDWPDIEGVIDKISEEAREVADARASGIHDHIEDEIGDLLFAVTNLARHLKIDPELALRRTNDKFKSRFQYIENKAFLDKHKIEDMSLSDMEAYWQAAKNR